MRQGNKNGSEFAMPPDLDASYLKLNLPRSPLPTNGLLLQKYKGAEQHKI